MRAPAPRARRPALAGALAGLLLLAAAGPVAGHEVRPGYLEISAQDGDGWSLLFKVPARGDRRLSLDVRLPAGCEASAPVARFAGGAHVERWQARCPDGLVGERVEIAGLARTRTDVLVRVHHGDGSTQTRRLTPGSPGFTVEEAPGPWAVAGTYLVLGVEHILLGIDHLLFVAALLLLVGDLRRLVGAVTAFTVSHSLTLGAAALGWLRVAPPPVEAAIALSIVLVAAEVVHGRDSLARRRPWLVAFAFGLLHGLGFAGALAEVGLPDHAIPVALACFNLGVEIGQLLFVAALFVPARAAARLSGARFGAFALLSRVARPAAYLIGTAGAYWLVERTLSFWGV